MPLESICCYTLYSTYLLTKRLHVLFRGFYSKSRHFQCIKSNFPWEWFVKRPVYAACMHERQEIPLSHFLISRKNLISFGYVICKPQHFFICLIFWVLYLDNQSLPLVKWFLLESNMSASTSTVHTPKVSLICRRTASTFSIWYD